MIALVEANKIINHYIEAAAPKMGLRELKAIENRLKRLMKELPEDTKGLPEDIKAIHTSAKKALNKYTKAFEKAQEKMVKSPKVTKNFKDQMKEIQKQLKKMANAKGVKITTHEDTRHHKSEDRWASEKVETSHRIALKKGDAKLVYQFWEVQPVDGSEPYYPVGQVGGMDETKPTWEYEAPSYNNRGDRSKVLFNPEKNADHLANEGLRSVKGTEKLRSELRGLFGADTNIKTTEKDYIVQVRFEEDADYYRKSQLDLSEGEQNTIESMLKGIIDAAKKLGAAVGASVGFEEHDYYEGLGPGNSESYPVWSVKNGKIQKGWRSYEEIPKAWGYYVHVDIAISKLKRKVAVEDLKGLSRALEDIPGSLPKGSSRSRW